jgi:hypothetical protein
MLVHNSMITAICLIAGLSGLSTFGVVAAAMAAKRTAIWGSQEETAALAGTKARDEASGMLLPFHGR